MRKTNKVLVGVLTTAMVLGTVVSPVMAIFPPERANQGKGDVSIRPIHKFEVEAANYQSVKGYAQKIEERNGLRYLYVTSEYEEGNVQESYFVISEDTLVRGHIESGVEVEGVYDANMPMIMIYPPQYTVVAVKTVEDGRNVKVDKFEKHGDNEQLISEDGSLVLNIDKETEIRDSMGDPYLKDITGKILYIEYGSTTRSLPPQTTPDVVIVLEEEAEIKDNGKDKEQKEKEKLEKKAQKQKEKLEKKDKLEKQKGVKKDKDFHGNIMQNLGILKGTDKGLELDKGLTRAEGAVMFARLLGLEGEIEKFAEENPEYELEFTDVPQWVRPTINYLKAKGLVAGVGNDKYGSEDFMTETQYATLILRALGYEETSGDFKWDTAKDKVKEFGIYDLDELKPEEILQEKFTRRGMAYMSYNALYFENKLDGELLLDKLLK